MPNLHMSQSQSISIQQGGMGGNGMGSHQSNPMQGQSPMHSQNNMHQMNSLMSHGGQQMQNQPSNNQHNTFPSLHNPSSFSGQVADFNLDFLDNMSSNETTAQELLSSLDNSFLNDILWKLTNRAGGANVPLYVFVDGKILECKFKID